MEYSREHRPIMGVASGAAACFWILFSIFWACPYIQYKVEQRTFMSRQSVPFHFGALIYQLLTILFYGFNCVFEFTSDRTQAMVIFNWLFYAVYLSAAYTVGMSFSLGFGTLYTTIPAKQTAMLVATGLIVLAALLAEFADTPIVSLSASIVMLAMFAVQIFAAFCTFFTMRERIVRSKASGYDDYAVSLTACKKKMTLVIGMFCVLFAAMLMDVLLDTKVSEEVMWIVFVVIAIGVNGWVLVLMRPNAGLMDVQILHDSIRDYNRL